MKTSQPQITENDFPKLSQPAQRALAAAGIHNLKELSKFSEVEIGKLHGMGPKSLVALRAALKSKGLSFSAAAQQR